MSLLRCWSFDLKLEDFPFACDMASQKRCVTAVVAVCLRLAPVIVVVWLPRGLAVIYVLSGVLCIIGWTL